MPDNKPRSCPCCGESYQAAMRSSGHCANCTGTEPSIGRGCCWICERDDVPLQRHHSAGRRYSDDTIDVCLNCHSVLSQWQHDYPRLNEWHAQAHGLADILRLNLERTAPHERSTHHD